MAEVIITRVLEEEINKRFKGESVIVFSLLNSLEESPHKGKILTVVGKVAVGEIRYRKFRFFFLTDGHKLKLFCSKEIDDLILKFVRMSEKKDQQKTIDGIKLILKSIGEEGF